MVLFLQLSCCMKELSREWRTTYDGCQLKAMTALFQSGAHGRTSGLTIVDGGANLPNDPEASCIFFLITTKHIIMDNQMTDFPTNLRVSRLGSFILQHADHQQCMVLMVSR